MAWAGSVGSPSGRGRDILAYTMTRGGASRTVYSAREATAFAGNRSAGSKFNAVARDRGMRGLRRDEYIPGAGRRLA